MAEGKRKINGRAAFLALKDEIKAELEAGAFANSVHARYKQRLGIGYRQFLKYLRRYQLRDATPSEPIQPVHAARSANRRSPVALADEAPPREPVNARPEQPRQFVFNPADIDPKKLI